MNKFKKVGLTALAGSLVAVSAHAGELSVTGGANITLKTWYTLQHQTHLVEVSVQTKTLLLLVQVSLITVQHLLFSQLQMIAQTDLTSGYISISTPSFGSFLMGNHSGAAHYKYDEEVPQAYEQISDITATVTQNKVGDFMDNNHITYTSPTFDLGGASITLTWLCI